MPRENVEVLRQPGAVWSDHDDGQVVLVGKGGSHASRATVELRASAPTTSLARTAWTSPVAATSRPVRYALGVSALAAGG